jgi:molybdopterin molybdotransferase
MACHRSAAWSKLKAMAAHSAGPISFEAARHLVEEHATLVGASGTEEVDLLNSCGRVLAELIAADRPFPPFPRAARDGYAVRAADVAHLPARLRVIGEIRAGADSNLQVVAGQAVSIMTGAAAPPGADAVVMVEYTTLHGQEVEIRQKVDLGANIVPTGSEAGLGEQLLSPGMRIDPPALAVAASAGKSRLSVFKEPRIAILATGDEIVPVTAKPGSNQIRNSNTYSLAAQIRAAGGEPVLLPVAPDEPIRLRELILQGLQSDLLLLSGGVSMGKYDLVEQVLSELGAQFLFTSVAIQPGKPAVFGNIQSGADTPVGDRRNHTYFFGLPGNPVSTMVTFDLFAKPIIEALAGMQPRKLVFPRAQLKAEIKLKPGLRRFLPAVLSGEFDDPEVELSRWQGSGDIAATARANCYAVISPDREKIAAGEWVSILLR